MKLYHVVFFHLYFLIVSSKLTADMANQSDYQIMTVFNAPRLNFGFQTSVFVSFLAVGRYVLEDVSADNCIYRVRLASVVSPAATSAESIIKHRTVVQTNRNTINI